jgi:hypothetical protein
MAHFVPSPESLPKKKRSISFKMPNINGRIGASLYLGTKELFLGIVFSDVITEQIIRKKIVKVPKADTRVLGFDPLGGDYADPTDFLDSHGSQGSGKK